MESILSTPITAEDDAMRKLKKYAQVDLTGAEGLYETTVDRWSRNAKHHLSQAEKASAPLVPVFEEGEIALYEGRETVVKIPQGPMNTVGILQQGQLKMIHESKLLKRVEEGVMGGVKPMPAINRIMQLAGLEHTGATVTEETPVVEEAALLEAMSNDMLTNLVTSAENMPEYKGNAEAARFYAIGSVLAMLGKSLQSHPPQTVVGQGKAKELNVVAAMGADLIQTAHKLAQASR
jgi:hypothetical protein